MPKYREIFFNLQTKIRLLYSYIVVMVYTVSIGEKFKFFGDKGIQEVFPTFGSLVSALLPNLYILSGLVFLVLLIFGGLSLIMAAGGQNPQQAEKGKNAVTAALIGFLLIFVSFWIIKIIETITGVKILSL